MSIDLDALEALIAPRLAFLSLEVVLIEQVTLHGRPTLRVYIDGPDGVTLDDCAKVNRLLTGMAELEGEISERYDFEVSSPGIERPLRKAEHFARFIGENAQLKLASPRDGRKKLTGRIAAVDGEVVTIDVEGVPVSLPVSEIARARLKPDMEALMAVLSRSTD